MVVGVVVFLTCVGAILADEGALHQRWRWPPCLDADGHEVPPLPAIDATFVAIASSVTVEDDGRITIRQTHGPQLDDETLGTHTFDQLAEMSSMQFERPASVVFFDDR